MFEHRNQRLASSRTYRRRLVQSGTVGLITIVVSLAVGMAGYHWLESLEWLDAFVNASMLLSGMGPLHNPETAAGKLFAGIYALYSGFAVLVIAAIMFAPVVHRILHRFHIEEADEEAKAAAGRKKPKAS